MKPIVKFSALLLFCAFLYSCSKDNETELSGTNNNPGTNNPATCDTVGMKFSANVVPILQAACYNCHSNANLSVSGVSLEGYSNVKARVDDGKLLGTITHASGFTPMPQGGPKLSDCNINKIRSWIIRGAQND